MLGWHISVFRQAGGGLLPATPKAEQGDRIAAWQTGTGGLDWLNELVSQGRAINLGGDGYPYWYTAQSQHIASRIIDEAPEAREFWTFGRDDLIGEGWEGRTKTSRDASDSCRPDEWLTVEVWDES